MTFSMVFIGCVHSSPKVEIPDNTVFYSGDAKIFDKKKNKTEKIKFYVASSYPKYVRIDVSVGLLNIPLGTLLLRENKAQFVNLIEGKDYRSEDGERALERLLKAKLSPRHLIALFSEEFPLAPPWQCRKLSEQAQKCENVDLFLDWKKENTAREVHIESEKSSVELKYSEDKKRNVSFEWLSPQGFEKVML